MLLTIEIRRGAAASAKATGLSPVALIELLCGISLSFNQSGQFPRDQTKPRQGTALSEELLA
jgi:hypothetical protein